MQMQKISRTKHNTDKLHQFINIEGRNIDEVRVFFLSPSLKSAFSSRVNKTSGFNSLDTI